jgi:sortase B
MDKKRSHLLSNILIALFVLIALGSGIYIYKTCKETKDINKQFSDLKDMIGTKSSDNEEEGEEEILDKYKALYEKNNEFAGWVSIEGTNIDYPVMLSPEDGEYYLSNNFDKEHDGIGIPFIDARVTLGVDRSDNVLIYGHNMSTGIMFHELTKYDDEEFYKEHKYVKFDTIYEEGTYEIIGVVRTQVYDVSDTTHYRYEDFIDAVNKQEYDAYIDFIKESSMYETDSTAEYGDELITLSTCAYHVKNGRFIVVAKKIS